MNELTAIKAIVEALRTNEGALKTTAIPDTETAQRLLQEAKD